MCRAAHIQKHMTRDTKVQAVPVVQRKQEVKHLKELLQQWQSSGEVNKIAHEEWREIPGYHGRYQVSVDGEVRRVLKNGKYNIMTPYFKKHNDRYHRQPYMVVKLSYNYKSKEEKVHALVAHAFLKDPGNGYVIWHKDGLQSNNRLSNLEYISTRKLGKKTGASSRRKPVVKIGADGQDIEYYSSARAAGKENFMSHQAITDRCNGDVKKPFGKIDFAWDDSETSRKKCLERLKRVKEEKQ